MITAPGKEASRQIRSTQWGRSQRARRVTRTCTQPAVTAGGQASNTTGVPLSLLTALTALCGWLGHRLSRPETGSNNLQSSSQQEAGQAVCWQPPPRDPRNSMCRSPERQKSEHSWLPQALPWEPTRGSGVLSWWLPKMWPWKDTRQIPPVLPGKCSP